MTTMLQDVLDLETLTVALDAGHVSVQTHPVHGYRIFNYTAACQYDRGWNPTTLACRGLIVSADDVVLARPFPKFFNYGEVPLRAIPGRNPELVTHKEDGSLGIIYPTPDGHAVATRGSFTSDQAVWATEWLNRNDPGFTQPDGVTTLVEIIYPDNRVVVDYAGMEALVLIAAIRVDSGADVPLWEIDWWAGETAPRRPSAALDDINHVASSDQFAQGEGLVATWLHPDQPAVRVKFKHPEYVRLHRILTNMSARRLWETAAVSDLRNRGCTAKEIGWATGLSAERVDQMLAQPDLFGPLLEKVPDEFYRWVKGQLDGFQEAVGTFVYDAEAKAWDVHDLSRKQAAEKLKGDPLAGAVFKLLDRRDIYPMAWRSVRPSHELPFQSEES
jgi:RNA ligase